jgi:hypothetical protein
MKLKKVMTETTAKATLDHRERFTILPKVTDWSVGFNLKKEALNTKLVLMKVEILSSK